MSSRILVVEDHDDTRHMMAALLGARGYGVETASGYGEGLRLAGDGSYDLILLDYRYADGTGAELCRRIREADPDTPILFFSGVDPKAPARGGFVRRAGVRPQAQLRRPVG
jgi:two-component system, OmpR family, manganese sensing response regulator